MEAVKSFSNGTRNIEENQRIAAIISYRETKRKESLSAAQRNDPMIAFLQDVYKREKLPSPSTIMTIDAESISSVEAELAELDRSPEADVLKHIYRTFLASVSVVCKLPSTTGRVRNNTANAYRLDS